MCREVADSLTTIKLYFLAGNAPAWSGSTEIRLKSPFGSLLDHGYLQNPAVPTPSKDALLAPVFPCLLSRHSDVLHEKRAYDFYSIAQRNIAVLTVNPFYRSIKGQLASREDAFSYAHAQRHHACVRCAGLRGLAG
jgi:hypothetical protein